MRVTESIEIDASPAEVASVLGDLGCYPDWLDIVGRAVDAPPADDDPGPAWFVDLRAQLGPLRRSKRLRMVRTTATDARVAFERRELDGRNHSPWLLDVHLSASRAGCVASVSLAYEGSLWLPMLDRVLAEEIRRARRRLPALVAARR